MNTFILIKRVNNKVINIIKFVIIKIHLSELIKDKSVIAIIKMKVYIINYLITNFLIEIDVIKLEKMTLNLHDEKLIINSC